MLYEACLCLKIEPLIDWYLNIVSLFHCYKIIHFFQIRPKSPFAHFNDVLLDNKESLTPVAPPLEDDKSTDGDVLNLEPMAKPRPRYEWSQTCW